MILSAQIFPELVKSREQALTEGKTLFRQEKKFGGDVPITEGQSR